MLWDSKETKQNKLQKQYNNELKDLLVKINSNSERSNLFANIQGGGYDHADALHNVYCDFGYPGELDFFNFWNMFRRFGVAGAVINIPPNLSWLSPPMVKGSDQFDKELTLLIKSTNLWNRLKGLDKRQRVGEYAGLFVQVKDGKKPEEPVENLGGVGSISNLKPIYEGQLDVLKTEQDVTKEGYGQPSMYQFQPGSVGSKNPDENSTINIHPSRIIIAAEGADDGSIYGISALENIFNDLMDLRKISGAGGEGFYQNTRSAPMIEVDDKFQTPKGKAKEELEQQIDDFLGKWQKKFVSKGMKFVYPNIKLDNPKDFAENSWNNISAGSGISSSELRGSQTGVLAGDKDNKSTMLMVQSRRENFLTEMVTDFIDWCILHKVLPSSPYEVEWDDMTASSDSDKLDLADKMASVNEKSFKSGLGTVFSEDEMREIAGHDPETFEEPNESLEEDDNDPQGE